MTEQTKERMNAEALPVNGDALQGARRATEDASPFAPPNPEVAATARRRQFSAADRTRILNAADACKQPGDIGALMRREGIYSSLLSTWTRPGSTSASALVRHDVGASGLGSIRLGSSFGVNGAASAPDRATGSLPVAGSAACAGSSAAAPWPAGKTSGMFFVIMIMMLVTVGHDSPHPPADSESEAELPRAP